MIFNKPCKIIGFHALNINGIQHKNLTHSDYEF